MLSTPTTLNTPAADAPAAARANAFRALALMLPGIRQFIAGTIEGLEGSILEPSTREALTRRYGRKCASADEAAATSWLLSHAGGDLRVAATDFHRPLRWFAVALSPLQRLALAAALEARAVELIESLRRWRPVADARSLAIIDDFAARVAAAGPTASGLMRQRSRPGLLDRLRLRLRMFRFERRIRACFAADWTKQR